LNLEDGAEKIEEWLNDYNDCRPHSSLGDRTPQEFAASFAQAAHERSKLIPNIPTGSGLG